MSFKTFSKLKINDEIYYPLTKLSHYMALKILKFQGSGPNRKSTLKFKHEENRIYNTLYEWCRLNFLHHIKVNTRPRVYVSEFDYNNLVNLVRIIDCTKLAGVSRRTIHNWINQKLLPVTKSPSGSPLISVKDLDETLIFILQREYIKKYINNQNILYEIDDFSSCFWGDQVLALRKLSFDHKKIDGVWNAEKVDEYILSHKGWTKIKIRALKAIYKKRKLLQSIDQVIDSPNGDEYDSFISNLEDKNMPNPCQIMQMKELKIY